jgi:hypothetical protein
MTVFFRDKGIKKTQNTSQVWRTHLDIKTRDDNLGHVHICADKNVNFRAKTAMAFKNHITSVFYI